MPGIAFATYGGRAIVARERAAMALRYPQCPHEGNGDASACSTPDRLTARQRLLLFHRLSIACPPVRQRHRRQPHHCHGVIVCGNPVLPLDAAAIASVHQHLLPICPECHADGGHQPAAWALPVAWPSPVDVPGGQAIGTVVPMLATGDRLSYESAAMPAAKGLILVPMHSWPKSLHCSACLSLAST
jgi:hypothetical protein